MLSRSLARSLAHPLSRNMVWESGSIPLPTINGQPSNVTVRDGQQATFTVTAIGATSYQWQRSDDGISFSNISGATANSYTFTTVRSTDNGDRFRCICTNTQGSVTSTSATLTVNLKDILAKVGTSTSPTTTGTKAVTGVGFQPKVVMPFGGPSISSGTSILGAIIGMGAGLSSSNRACIAVSSNNGVTTSDTDRRHDNSRIFTTLSSTGSILEACDLTSLDAGGFTLNWTTIDPNARLFNHICLGGADLEVSLTQHQMNATNAPQSFAHGLSGAPTGLLVFTTWDNLVPPNTSTHIIPSIGAWSSSSQFSANIYSLTNLSTTNTKRGLRNDCVASVNDSFGTFQRTMAISSVDSTNVNCTYPITIGGVERYFWMLAIRGAKCQTGTFDHNGSLSPLTINTPGITPKLFLPVFVPTGVSSVNTVLNDAIISIGASDGVNNVSCGITDQNGVTTTNSRRYQASNSLVEYNSGGTLRTEATASFNGQSVVISPTTALDSGVRGQGFYMVIGA